MGMNNAYSHMASKRRQVVYADDGCNKKIKNMKKLNIPKWLIYILYGIGIYAAWFILGIILVETKIINEFPVGFGGSIVDEHKNRDTSMADIESPLIFYSDNFVVVKRVIRQDTLLAAQIDTFRTREYVKSLNIEFSDKKFNFTTNLKDSLTNERSSYENVGGILAISDIEGNFKAFKTLLINNKVIDDKYNWTFGDKHLVLLGDFFDRGLNVTECLWLIYDLEEKAKKAGGYVHFILGNHEIMNMSDNLKYVRNKYIENSFLIKENYKKWYKPNTELGKWLQTKNTIEKIENMLFVHGGISEEILKLNLEIDEINELCRKYYFTAYTAQKSDDNKLKLLFDTKLSHCWYRGYVNEDVNEEFINNVLQRFGVNRIVVGHTIVSHVSSFYSGKVIAIDTKHSEGINEGLYTEGEMIFKIDMTGLKNQMY